MEREPDWDSGVPKVRGWARDLVKVMVMATVLEKDLASGRPMGLVWDAPLESALRAMATVWGAHLELVLAPASVWQTVSALDVVPESVLVPEPDELALVEPVLVLVPVSAALVLVLESGARMVWPAKV